MVVEYNYRNNMFIIFYKLYRMLAWFQARANYYLGDMRDIKQNKLGYIDLFLTRCMAKIGFLMNRFYRMKLNLLPHHNKRSTIKSQLWLFITALFTIIDIVVILLSLGYLETEWRAFALFYLAPDDC